MRPGASANPSLRPWRWRKNKSKAPASTKATAPPTTKPTHSDPHCDAVDAADADGAKDLAATSAAGLKLGGCGETLAEGWSAGEEVPDNEGLAGVAAGLGEGCALGSGDAGMDGHAQSPQDLDTSGLAEFSTRTVAHQPWPDWLRSAEKLLCMEKGNAVSGAHA
jgi:hypothetical protein